MKAQRVLNISGNRYLLPENMPTKDIQALIGFLSLFVSVGNKYDYINSRYVHYPESGLQLQLESLEMMDRAAAEELHESSYKKYTTDRKAKEAAAA